MQKTCCAAAAAPVFRVTPVTLALAAMLMIASPADAASIGHSRMVSAPGQALQIDIPLRQLSQSDIQSLRVGVAPLQAWQQAGLTPPVQLSSMQATVESGFGPDSRVIRVRSSQPFDGPVADLLLQVDTAAGRQQHQVSLLANASRSAQTASGQAGAGATASSGASMGAAATDAIRVRRGDTLFALARAHAVEGVTVYQMMAALQKANPQAFIDGNMNLVKAGSTLAVPDVAALRAVSDREARRIFQQQAQAYAAYRQGIAARRGQAVQGASAQSGAVSNGAASVPATSTAASGDQVVLSSGSASDALDDQQDATQRNIDESQARVSQLERNVQSLNQALQMQGEAAKDAVLDGAAAVSQTLSEAATSIGVASDDSGATETPVNGEASPSGSGSGQAGDAAASQANGAAQTQPGGAGAAQAGSGQGNSASASGDAAVSNGAAASVSGQNGQAARSGQPAAGGATQPGGSPDAGAAQSAGSAGAAGSQQSAAAAAGDSNLSTSSKAEQPVSWLQQNLLGVITAVLALIVLVIAWVLRRASASRGSDGQGGVTEAMVQERLEKIDLNLDAPPADGRPPHTT